MFPQSAGQGTRCQSYVNNLQPHVVNQIYHIFRGGKGNKPPVHMTQPARHRQGGGVYPRVGIWCVFASVLPRSPDSYRPALPAFGW